MFVTKGYVPFLLDLFPRRCAKISAIALTVSTNNISYSE